MGLKPQALSFSAKDGGETCEKYCGFGKTAEYFRSKDLESDFASEHPTNDEQYGPTNCHDITH
jgi:hypothetical protein